MVAALAIELLLIGAAPGGAGGVADTHTSSAADSADTPAADREGARPADDATPPPVAPDEHWYGWQMLVVDAGTMLAAVTGNPFAAWAALPAPAYLHGVHGNSGRALGSLALRLGLPYIGLALLNATCRDTGWLACLDDLAAGWYSGWALAILIDDFGLSWAADETESGRRLALKGSLGQGRNTDHLLPAVLLDLSLESAHSPVEHTIELGLGRTKNRAHGVPLTTQVVVLRIMPSWRLAQTSWGSAHAGPVFGMWVAQTQYPYEGRQGKLTETAGDLGFEVGAAIVGRWQPAARLSVELGLVGSRRLGLDPVELTTPDEVSSTKLLAPWATELQLGIGYGPF